MSHFDVISETGMEWEKSKMGKKYILNIFGAGLIALLFLLLGSVKVFSRAKEVKHGKRKKGL